MKGLLLLWMAEYQMKHPFFHLFIFIVISILPACREEMSPLLSGTVWHHTADGKPIQRALTTEQLGSLSSWLEKHLSGWDYCLATLPANSSLDIVLKHVNGKSSGLRVFSEQATEATIAADRLVGSNMSDSPCALQTFSEQDIRELRTALAIGQ